VRAVDADRVLLPEHRHRDLGRRRPSPPPSRPASDEYGAPRRWWRRRYGRPWRGSRARPAPPAAAAGRPPARATAAAHPCVKEPALPCEPALPRHRRPPCRHRHTESHQAAPRHRFFEASER
jgi:hypothetical protein